MHKWVGILMDRVHGVYCVGQRNLEGKMSP